MIVTRRRRGAELVTIVAVVSTVLAGCGSGGGAPAPAKSAGAASASSSAASGGPSASAPKFTSKIGVKIAPGYGASATLAIPTTKAPSTLTDQLLTRGTGKPVAAGDLLVANYVGETWARKDGKANVFDSSFSRGAPAAFAIGTGSVIPGWDKTLVGKPLGSRVLMTLPPADGYGSSGNPQANISGTDTLVFVVDLIKAYGPDATAPGKEVAKVPQSGLPSFVSTPGKAPKITSTAGVSKPAKPTSTLLVTGSGAKIDASKTLVLQVVQAPIKAGKIAAKDSQSTWPQAPQPVAAQSILGIANVLSGQRLGSRALVLLPATAAVPASATQQARPAEPASALIVDVIGQF